MTNPPRDMIVLLRRLDALDDAIREGSRNDIRFVAEQVRSAAERLAGTRGREVDDLREKLNREADTVLRERATEEGS